MRMSYPRASVGAARRQICDRHKPRDSTMFRR